MPPKTAASTTEEITARIRNGQRFVMRGIGDRDRNHCRRFLDGSETANLFAMGDDWDNEGNTPDTAEIGNVNYLATNIGTKTSSIAVADPDFYIETEEDDPNEMMEAQALGLPMPLSSADKAKISRQYLKDLWRDREWARLIRKALLKRCISGLGVIAYLWNQDKGPVLEHVRVQDLAIDPSVTDWNNARWAARRIRMPRKDALARWPKLAEKIGSNVQTEILNLDIPTNHSKDTLELWLYYDLEGDGGAEVILYGEQELERNKNLYGKVPLVFLQGDILPESEFSGGDYDAALGLQLQLSRLAEQINEQAENGGAIGWVNFSLLDDASKDAFQDGRPSGFVGIQGDATDVFGYVSGIPMNPAVIEAFRLAQQGLDSATGVSEYQRGVLNQSVKFATEAALLANQSGARGVAAKIEFELFVDKIARAVVDMTLRFGPSLADPDSDEENLLLQSLASAHTIQVIESSTSYKDPAMEQQSNMQLLQILMPFIQMGVINPIPLIADLLRAFQKRDVAKYLTPQAQAMLSPQAMLPQPGMMPGQPPISPNPAPGNPAAEGQAAAPGPQGAPGAALLHAGQPQ